MGSEKQDSLSACQPNPLCEGPQAYIQCLFFSPSSKVENAFSNSFNLAL